MIAVAKIPTRMITIAITITSEEPPKHIGSASDRGCYLHLCANVMLAESPYFVSACIECTALIE